MSAVVMLLAYQKPYRVNIKSIRGVSKQSTQIHDFLPDAANNTNDRRKDRQRENLRKLISKSGSPSSRFVHPDPNLPLKQLMTLLQNDAAAGNKPAADRLSKDLLACNAYLMTRWVAKGQLGATRNIAGMPREEITRKETLLGDVGDQLARNSSLCSGIDEQYIREHAFDVLLYAARTGNEDAASCFLSGDLFPSSGTDDSSVRNWGDVYHVHAINFIERGVKQGDWRVVNLVALAYSGAASDADAFLGTLITPDPLGAYAWLRLARLGATGNEGDTLDRRLDWIISKNDLQAGQIIRADAWASGMFRQYFGDELPFSKQTTGVCGAL